MRAAVGRGADGLAMAGGDGSQALVAAIAAEHDLPYACIPAGTRNHFALDLGVDREDVVGALDAFGDGGERYVDLGEVNGRVFVNNVSLGVYAEAVGQDGYREAKLRTLLDTLSETLGPDGEPAELRWRDGDGERADQHGAGPRLQQPVPAGADPRLRHRPRLDARRARRRRLPAADRRARGRQRRASASCGCPSWRSRRRPVPVGIDGEAVTLEPPLRFRIRPRALRVRIARDHPGASPSADSPARPAQALRRWRSPRGLASARAIPEPQIQRTIMMVMSTQAGEAGNGRRPPTGPPRPQPQLALSIAASIPPVSRGAEQFDAVRCSGL